MTTLYVVPCGAGKATTACRARDLYTGGTFRLVLAASEATAEAGDRVLILSALYGLVDPDEIVEPYDLRMDQPGAVTIATLALQLLALGATEAYAFLPRAYRAALEAAAAIADLPVFDVYEAAPGIGHMRGVAASVKRTAELVAR